MNDRELLKMILITVCCGFGVTLAVLLVVLSDLHRLIQH